jgi:hypothetical protein
VRRSARPSVSACALFTVTLFTVLPLRAMASTLHGKTPDLSGTWQLNDTLSDNGRSELPGNLDSPGRLSLIQETEPCSEAETDSLICELLEATQLIEIFHDGARLTMNAIGSSKIVLTRTLFTDDRPSEQRFGFGEAGVGRGNWNEQKLIIETEMNCLNITETYELNTVLAAKCARRMSILLFIFGKTSLLRLHKASICLHKLLAFDLVHQASKQAFNPLLAGSPICLTEEVELWI